MLNIKNTYNPGFKENTISVFEIDRTKDNLNLKDLVPIYTRRNKVTNEMAEILAGKALDQQGYGFTHIYGQWGDPLDFPENTGPFFTPSELDTVADLTGGNFFTTNAEEPIIKSFSETQENQALYANNVANYIALISGNDNMSYIGVGLVNELPGGTKLLAAHSALPGIIKKPSADLLILWSLIFTNN